MRTVNEKCPVKDWEAFGEALALDLDRQSNMLDKWSVEPKPDDYRPEYVVLTEAKGAKLVFSMLWSNPERVEITGMFPKGFDKRYDEKPYEITVTLTKTPSRIVRDIRQRLFPAYLVRLTEAKAQVADTAAREARRAFVAREFAQVLGTIETIERNGKPIAEVSKPLINANPARAEFNIGYPDKDGKLDVSVEIRWCPPALAKDIAALVAEYNATQAKAISA